MKRVEPYASAAQQAIEKPRKTTSINSLCQDALGHVFGFLVGTRLEDVAPLAEVNKAFNVAAKKPILIRKIRIRTHGRFGRVTNQDEASAKLLEYLRQPLSEADFQTTTFLLATKAKTKMAMAKNNYLNLLLIFIM